MKRSIIALSVGLGACGSESERTSAATDVMPDTGAGGDAVAEGGTADSGVADMLDSGSGTTTDTDASEASGGSTACHPAFVEAIANCFETAKMNADPNVVNDWDLQRDCATAERLSAVRAELCGSPAGGAESVCDLDASTFASVYVPVCAVSARDAWLDAVCVFGDRYGDLAGRAEAVIVMMRETHDSPATLDGIASEQVIEAVRSTAYDDIKTIEEAFEVVDEGLVHETLLWDASNRKAFVVFEVGAGDNSFGAYFPLGSASTVARINDGDVISCSVTWGSERRRCGADSECGVGACRGLVNGLGRCIDASLDDDPSRGLACSSDGDGVCAAEGGMICAGASIDGEGLCGPAWMRGRFEADLPEAARTNNDGAPLFIPVEVFGLASVDTDVRVDLLVTTSDFSSLEIALVHASGTKVTLFSGARDVAPPNGELYLRGSPVSGFPGDEAVNGTWGLEVSGVGAMVYGLSLEITSRWD